MNYKIAAMTQSFVIGKGTKVDIAMLPVGSKVEPTPITLTTAGTVTAKDITSPASITLASAIPVGKEPIPAGSFVGFKAPTTGKLVIVQLVQDAEPGDTELAVDVIPEPIAASSVAQYPLRLSARTGANIDRTGKRVSSVDFDSGAFETGLTASIAQKLDLAGNYLPQDAGFCTAEYAFNELREIFVWIELPKISAAYSKGKIYKGFASISGLPLGIPADGILTGNISVELNGKLEIVPDAPVA